LRLTILEGPHSGEVFLLGAEERAVVGRAPDCQFTIQDPSLSRRHIELFWARTSCRLIDLGSTNGTLVNGAPVRETTLRSEDRIRAGDILLRVELFEEPIARPLEPVSRAKTHPTEPEPPPAGDLETTRVRPTPIFGSVVPSLADRPASEPSPGSLLENLLKTLRAHEPVHLYALIDGAQAIELALTARLIGLELYTVFSGEMAPDVAHAGPCLVPLKLESDFMGRWVEALGSHAGILFETSADLDTVHAHLRDIFIVRDQEGQEFFFRYYDPRVLRTFLPTCTPDELEAFFGPVKRWVAEQEKSGGYEIYSLEGSAVKAVSVSV